MLNAECFCSSVVCWPEAAQAMALQPEKTRKFKIVNGQSSIANHQFKGARGSNR
jgi:hypothetical protein